MSGRQILAISCAGVFILGILTCVLVGVLLVKMTNDPEDIMVTVSAPDEVQLKKPMELVVQIENRRSRKDFKLTDIDISEDFLEAFVVLSTTQEVRSSTNAPFENSRSFHFNDNIPAGETREYCFGLRPLEPGLHRSDIDICEGMNFLTQMAQVYVLDEGESLLTNDEGSPRKRETSGDAPEVSEMEAVE